MLSFDLVRVFSAVSSAHNRMSMKQFQMSVLSTSPWPTPRLALNGGAGAENGSVAVYDCAFP